MKCLLAFGLSLVSGSILAAPFSWGELLPPARVVANGQPLEVWFGNAAPFVGDFDGDGVFDLLLGQGAECKLRIFRNIGSNKEPRFGPWAFFKAGGVDASLPGG